MRYFFPVLVVTVVGLTTHEAAAQNGSQRGGGGPAYSQAGHPVANHAMTNGAGSTSSSSNTKAVMSASVSLSNGNRAGTSFDTKTRQLSASFTTQGTKKGDQLQAVWLSSVNGRKKIYETKMTGDQANFGGSVSINGPAEGWPAGKYELDLFVNNKFIAHQPFTMGK